MKKAIRDIEAIPSKRLYLSIIADYHLDLALCELIDNAIDNWIFNGRHGKVTISITLDYQRQTIIVSDDSGGIKEEDLELIVSPGQTREKEYDELIGVFGVGSKRAVIALAEEVKIFSRHKNQKSLLVEVDDSWIADENNWLLKAYQVDPIKENTTTIELVKLRDPISEVNEPNLIDHFSSTYAYFLNSGNVAIFINSTGVKSKTYESWSFPPDYEPVHFSGPIDFGDKGKIMVDIIGGLTRSHKEDSSGDEFGVYFYCNNRLIARAYKGPEVGFKPPRIGKPHPSMSLARVIVKLQGTVELMPWNSSKSEIDFKHTTFKEIEGHIERILFTYTSMSKNWSGQWPEQVFKYDMGGVVHNSLSDISKSVKIHVPIVKRSPRVKKYGNTLKANNKQLATLKPWVVGTYETEIAVDQILGMGLEQSYRISMLLLDSALEIAFKDYLVNDSGTSFSESKLAHIMSNRSEVHKAVKATRVRISKDHWKKIEHFYRLRCDLVHKRSTVTISDNDLNSFRKTYKYTVSRLFKVNFSDERDN